jgi:hypothetical protein
VQAAETKSIFDLKMKTLAEETPYFSQMKMDKKRSMMMHKLKMGKRESFFPPARVDVNMQIPKELKRTPRIVEKSQLRLGMQGVLPAFVFGDVKPLSDINDFVPFPFLHSFGHIGCVWCEGYCESHGSFKQHERLERCDQVFDRYAQQTRFRNCAEERQTHRST